MTDAHGAGLPLIDVSSMKEVVQQVGFRNQVRSSAEKLDQLSH